MSRESGGGATVIPKIRNCTVAWGKGIPRVRPYFRAYNLLPKYWGMSSLKRKRTCLFSKRFGKNTGIAGEELYSSLLTCLEHRNFFLTPLSRVSIGIEGQWGTSRETMMNYVRRRVLIVIQN